VIFHVFAEVAARTSHPAGLTCHAEIAIHTERARKCLVEEETLTEETSRRAIGVLIRRIGWYRGKRPELFEHRALCGRERFDATRFAASTSAAAWLSTSPAATARVAA
jgi:hypothetical protein